MEYSNQCMDILNSDCILTHNDFIIVLNIEPILFHFVQGRRLRNENADFLFFSSNNFHEPFKVLHFLEHQGNIKLSGGLCSCFMNFFAISPTLNFVTKKSFCPVIDDVLHIEEKVEIVLFDLLPIIIVIKGNFGCSQFISVFIERHQKE